MIKEQETESSTGRATPRPTSLYSTMALVVKPMLVIEVGSGVDAVDEAGEVGLAILKGGLGTQTPMD